MKSGLLLKINLLVQIGEGIEGTLCSIAILLKISVDRKRYDAR